MPMLAERFECDSSVITTPILAVVDTCSYVELTGEFNFNSNVSYEMDAR